MHQLYRTLNQEAEFISSRHFLFLVTLAYTKIVSEHFERGLLAITRLIGAAYLKNFKNMFKHATTKSHYHTFNNPGLSPLDCHTAQWLQDVRMKWASEVNLKLKWCQILMLYTDTGKEVAGYGHVAASWPYRNDTVA